MTIVCVVAYLIIFLSLCGELCADVNEELKGINKEIKEKKLLINKTRKVENIVSNELQKINISLHEKELNLKSLGKDLKGVEAVLVNTQKDIDNVRKEADYKLKQIKLRLASLYKAGELGNTRTFFSSESLPQLVENIRYMQSVLVNDRNIYNEYTAKVERLKILKSSLENDLQRKEKIKQSIVDKKIEIEAEKKKKATYLSKLREEKKNYLASLHELEANARRLQAMVERLEAKSRKSYTNKSSQKKQIIGGQSSPNIPDKGFGTLKGKLFLPVKGEIISRFGRHKHPEFNSFTVNNGISISAPVGSDIHAVYDGQIIFADYFKGYGNMIIVDHGGGFFSLYAHASKLVKKVGINVTKNDVIANVGDSDSSKGSMLYFEIRYQGKPVDPALWFKL